MINHERVACVSDKIIAAFLSISSEETVGSFFEALMAFTYAYKKVVLAADKLEILSKTDVDKICLEFDNAAQIDCNDVLIDKLKAHLKMLNQKDE